MSKKKPQKTDAQSDKRKVRSGAMHKNQEELIMERAKAFARRVEMMDRPNVVTVITKPKAPWLYPAIKVRTLSKKAQFELKRGVS